MVNIMQRILFILFVGLFSGWVCAQEPVTVKSLGVSTFGSQVIGINNYAPAGSPGFNIWIGNGGQSSAFSTGNEGSHNISTGINALLSNTSGNFNISIGTNSLIKNLNGSNNVAFGLNALGSNISGSANVAIGFAALSSTITADYNLAIGSDAMLFTNTGFQNVALGFASMRSNTSGYYNVGLGKGSLFSNTIGNGNMACGVDALYNNTQGYFNIAMGNAAGAHASASNLLNQTSNTSIYIGYLSRASANGNSNEIVMGHEAIGNGSNTTTIGNSNTTHTVFQYGKTLVGYSASQDRGSYALQVNGQIYATNAAIATSDARLKERIAPLSSGLKEVMALRPCTFDFKQGSEQNLATGRQVGFIAQEVASVLQDREWASSVVQEAGGNLGIAETKLLPLLVKAVQEQQAQIEKLSAQLSLLQQQIGEMGAKTEATKSSAKKVALK